MNDKKDVTDTKKLIEEFKQWATKQKDFPKEIEDRIYLRFLHSCYYDLEKAKNALELFISLRNDSPELLCNRDPQSPDIQKTLRIVNLTQYKISGNRNLWIWQLNDPGLDNYDYLTDAKVFVLASDVWLLHNDFLEEGDVIIMDIKDISLKFLTKFNVSIAKKITKYQEEAMPIRLEQIHIVNCPPFIDMLYGLIKPFMKKTSSLLNFHSPNSNTLYNFLSKEELPADFGGTQPKMEDFMKIEVERFMNNRDRLMDDNLWRVNKKQATDKSDFSTAVGTFRTLAID